MFRYGDDQVSRVPELAAQLAQIPVDVVLAQGAAVSVLNKLDLPLPVVFASSGDPVAAGFAMIATRVMVGEMSCSSLAACRLDHRP